MNVDFNARKNMFTLRNDEILPPTGNPRLHTVFWRSFLGFLALGNSNDWHLQTHSKKHDFLGSRICSGLLCFCIEKVVILVLIFYRLLQGPDFRTFDLSEFSRRLACFSLRDAWLWPLYSSLPRATLTPGGSLLEWNKDWEDCHHGVRLERASRAFYLVNSIYPRQWGQVSLRSGPAFLLFFTQIPHRLRWRLMGGPQQRWKIWIFYAHIPVEVHCC